MKVIRPNQLAKRLGVSTVTLWRMENRGELPPRRQISQRIVGWIETEIDQWLENRPFVCDSKHPEQN